MFIILLNIFSLQTLWFLVKEQNVTRTGWDYWWSSTETQSSHVSAPSQERQLLRHSLPCFLSNSQGFRLKLCESMNIYNRINSILEGKIICFITDFSLTVKIISILTTIRLIRLKICYWVSPVQFVVLLGLIRRYWITENFTKILVQIIKGCVLFFSSMLRWPNSSFSPEQTLWIPDCLSLWREAVCGLNFSAKRTHQLYLLKPFLVINREVKKIYMIWSAPQVILFPTVPKVFMLPFTDQFQKEVYEVTYSDWAVHLHLSGNADYQVELNMSIIIVDSELVNKIMTTFFLAQSIFE